MTVNPITDQEREDLKRTIYEKMNPRRRKFVDRIGYEKWDPFQEPKDPIEMRKDPTSKRTTKQLIRMFLQAQPIHNTSTGYNAGALDAALGLVNKDERMRGIYEFCLWYDALLKKEGRTIDDE